MHTGIRFSGVNVSLLGGQSSFGDNGLEGRDGAETSRARHGAIGPVHTSFVLGERRRHFPRRCFAPLLASLNLNRSPVRAALSLLITSLTGLGETLRNPKNTAMFIQECCNTELKLVRQLEVASSLRDPHTIIVNVSLWRLESLTVHSLHAVYNNLIYVLYVLIILYIKPWSINLPLSTVNLLRCTLSTLCHFQTNIGQIQKINTHTDILFIQFNIT